MNTLISLEFFAFMVDFLSFTLGGFCFCEIWVSKRLFFFVQLQNFLTAAAIPFSAVIVKSLISSPPAISFSRLQEFGLILHLAVFYIPYILFASVPHKAPLKLFPAQDSDLFLGLRNI